MIKGCISACLLACFILASSPVSAQHLSGGDDFGVKNNTKKKSKKATKAPYAV